MAVCNSTDVGNTEGGLTQGAELVRLLAQLEAMLIHVTGDGGAAFALLADDVHDAYMDGCAALAGRCRDLAAKIGG